MAYKHVVCEVDGSEKSGEVQVRAAKIAKDNGARLTYIFLADTDFIEKLAPMTKGGNALNKGMENIGKVLLSLAKERAEKVGVESQEEVIQGWEVALLKKKLEKLEADLFVSHHERNNPIFAADKTDMKDITAEK